MTRAAEGDLRRVPGWCALGSVTSMLHLPSNLGTRSLAGPAFLQDGWMEKLPRERQWLSHGLQKQVPPAALAAAPLAALRVPRHAPLCRAPRGWAGAPGSASRRDAVVSWAALAPLRGHRLGKAPGRCAPPRWASRRPSRGHAGGIGAARPRGRGERYPCPDEPAPAEGGIVALGKGGRGSPPGPTARSLCQQRGQGRRAPGGRGRLPAPGDRARALAQRRR